MRSADRNGQIFMYGGEVYEDVANTVLDGAVYVLSLPSFNWKKQQDPLDFGRYFHRCAVAGNRQMISVGGSVLYGNTSSDAFGIQGGAYDRWPRKYNKELKPSFVGNCR